MNLPLDVYMKVSVINTYLRDFYPSLEEFCKSNDVDRDLLLKELAAVDYTYNPDTNRLE